MSGLCVSRDVNLDLEKLTTMACRKQTLTGDRSAHTQLNPLSDRLSFWSTASSKPSAKCPVVHIFPMFAEHFLVATYVFAVRQVEDATLAVEIYG